MRQALVCLLILVLLHSIALAKDIRVPQDHSTIQAAIDQAAPGVDRVVVTDQGTYTEALKINKNVTLVSEPAGAKIQAKAQMNVKLQVIDGPPSDGLLGYWPLDEMSGETVRDVSGADIGGKFFGEVQWPDNGGIINGAIYLQGKGSIVPDQQDVLEDTRDITVGAYVCIDSKTQNLQTLISRGHSWSVAMMDTGAIRFERSGLKPDIVIGKADVADGQWHYIACTQDLNSMRIYVDGRLDAQQEYQGQISASESKLWIGANSEVPGRGWRGYIDDVALWNRALDEEEIQNLATRGGYQPRADVGFHALSIAPSVTQLTLDGFQIANCFGHGICVQTGRSQDLTLLLNGVTISANQKEGIKIEAGTSVRLTLTGQSLIARNGRNGVLSEAPIQLHCENSRITENRKSGVLIAENVDGPIQLNFQSAELTDNREKGISCHVGVALHAIQTKFNANGENGIYLQGGDGQLASIILKGVEISKNGAEGVMQLDWTGQQEWNEVQLIGNQSTGFFTNSATDMTMTQCDFEQNQVGGFKIKNDEVSRQGSSKNHFVACTFTSNQPQGVLLEGACSAEWLFERCKFTSNDTGVEVASSEGALIVATFQTCSWDGNHQAGIRADNLFAITLSQSQIMNEPYGLICGEASEFKAESSVTIEGCQFQKLQQAIMTDGDIRLQITAMQSEFTENITGILIDGEPDIQEKHIVSLQGCTFEKNEDGILSLRTQMELDAKDSKFQESKKSGIQLTQLAAQSDNPILDGSVVASVTDCLIDECENGIFVGPNSFANLNVKGCDFGSNGVPIRVIGDRAFRPKISVKNSTVKNSSDDGIRLRGNFDAEISNCTITDGVRGAILLRDIEDAEVGMEEPSVIEVNSCILTDNFAGISISGSKARYKLILNKTKINANDMEALYIHDLFDPRVDITIIASETTFNNNGRQGIFNRSAHRMTCDMDHCQIIGNGSEGFVIGVAPCNVSLKDTTIARNGGPGLQLAFPGGTLQNKKARATESCYVNLAKCVIRGNGTNGMQLLRGDIGAPTLPIIGDGELPYLASINVEDSFFEENSHEGIWCQQQHLEMNFKNCVFQKNLRGGLTFSWSEDHPEYYQVSTSLNIENSQFINNNGHGISIGGPQNTNLTIRDSVISGNGFSGQSINGLDLVQHEKYWTGLTLVNTELNGNRGDGMLIRSFVYFDEIASCQFNSNQGNGIQYNVKDIQDRHKDEKRSNESISVSMDHLNISNNTKAGLTILDAPDHMQWAMADCQFNQNKIGLTCEIEKPQEMHISKSVFKNNRQEGAQFNCPAANLIVEQNSQFNSNSSNGLLFSAPFQSFSFRDSKCSANNSNGIWLNYDSMSMNDDAGQSLNITDSEIIENGNSGVVFSGLMNLNVDLQKTKFNENASGIRFALKNGSRCKATIADVDLSSNKANSIDITDEIVLQTKFNQANDHNVSASILSSNCDIQIKNVHFPDSHDRIGRVGASENSIYIAHPYIENLSSDVKVTTGDAVESNVSALSFDDVVHQGMQYDVQELIINIYDIFCKSNEGDVDPDEIWAYLNDHPNDVAACRLFQGTINTIIRFDRANDIKRISDFINMNPDSIVALSMAGELGLVSVLWKDDAEFKKMMDNVKISINAPAGIFFNELNEHKNLGQFQSSWAALLKNNPTAQKNINGLGTTGIIGRHEFFDKCERLACYLDLAVVWHKLGDIDKRDKYLSASQYALQSFYPSSLTGVIPPYELCKEYHLTRALIEKTETKNLHDILTMFGPDGQILINDVNQKIEARLDLYRQVMSSWELIQHSKKLPIENAEISVKDECMQSLMNEMLILMKMEVEPDIFEKYAVCLKEHYMTKYDHDEQMAALKWLGKQAEEIFKSQPSPLSMYYYKFSKEYYHELGDSSRKIEMAEKEIDSASKEIIEEYRKFELPEKEIEQHRKIIEMYPDSDKEMESRLAIAKILYEQNEYERAVFELTLLIEKAKEKYDLDPIQMMLGICYLNTGEYDDAREAFADVINRGGPARERCLYLTGYSHIIEQNYEKAVKPFKDLAHLYPNSPLAKKGNGYLEKISNIQ